jgi:hypothetical protein
VFFAASIVVMLPRRIFTPSLLLLLLLAPALALAKLAFNIATLPLPACEFTLQNSSDCRVMLAQINLNASQVEFCWQSPATPISQLPAVLLNITECSPGYAAVFAANNLARLVLRLNESTGAAPYCTTLPLDVNVQPGEYLTGRGCTVEATVVGDGSPVCNASATTAPVEASFQCAEGPAGPRTNCSAITLTAINPFNPPTLECRVFPNLFTTAFTAFLEYDTTLSQTVTFDVLQCSPGYMWTLTETLTPSGTTTFVVNATHTGAAITVGILDQNAGPPQFGRGCTVALTLEYDCQAGTGINSVLDVPCLEGLAVNCSALYFQSAQCSPNITFGQPSTPAAPLQFTVCGELTAIAAANASVLGAGLAIEAVNCSTGLTLTDNLGSPVMTTQRNLSLNEPCATLSYNVLAGGAHGPQHGRGCAARFLPPTGGCAFGTTLPNTTSPFAVCTENPAPKGTSPGPTPVPPPTPKPTTLLPTYATCSFILPCSTMSIPAQWILIVIGPLLFLVGLIVAFWYCCHRTREQKHLYERLHRNERQLAQLQSAEYHGPLLTR